jgi:hypothetical protein
MTTAVQKRLKELKQQEKQKAKTEVRRKKALAGRERAHHGRATGAASTHARSVTNADGHDIENPT